jgi:hypothetical protein
MLPIKTALRFGVVLTTLKFLLVIFSNLSSRLISGIGKKLWLARAALMKKIKHARGSNDLNSILLFQHKTGS